MADLYRIYFRAPEEDNYTSKRKIAKKKVKAPQPDPFVYLAADLSITVLEKDIMKYWDYAGGVLKLEWAGEMNDDYFKPVLSEVDFVDEQIKNKKNGDTVGYQG